MLMLWFDARHVLGPCLYPITILTLNIYAMPMLHPHFKCRVHPWKCHFLDSCHVPYQFPCNLVVQHEWCCNLVSLSFEVFFAFSNCPTNSGSPKTKFQVLRPVSLSLFQMKFFAENSVYIILFLSHFSLFNFYF